MVMAATAYKAKDRIGSHIATALACGFTKLQFAIILLVAPQNSKLPQNQSLLTYDVLL